MEKRDAGAPGDELFSTATAAAGLLSYQPGSVISREILKKKNGTVTVFAFDQGQGLSEHTAPFDALVLALEGEPEIVIAGVSHRLQCGDIILMPAGVPHAVRADKRFKMMLTLVRS